MLLKLLSKIGKYGREYSSEGIYPTGINRNRWDHQMAKTLPFSKHLCLETFESQTFRPNWRFKLFYKRIFPNVAVKNLIFLNKNHYTRIGLKGHRSKRTKSLFWPQSLVGRRSNRTIRKFWRTYSTCKVK